MEKGYLMKKLKDDIVISENFITEEEARKTIEVFKKLDEKEEGFWKPISFYESYSSGYPEDNDPILAEFGLPPTWFSDLYKKFKTLTAEMAGVPEEKLSKISFHSQRWLPGAFAPLHSDNTTNDGKYGAFERSRYAAFLYLNDDFEGGELLFPEHEITLVPKTGMIAAFHGGHKNLHQVDVVKKSPRYTIGSFWDDREESDYPDELREAWKAELLEVRAYQKEESVEWKDIREKGLRLSPDGKQYPAEEVERP
jgi:hypothetical protein